MRLDIHFLMTLAAFAPGASAALRSPSSLSLGHLTKETTLHFNQTYIYESYCEVGGPWARTGGLLTRSFFWSGDVLGNMELGARCSPQGALLLLLFALSEVLEEGSMHQRERGGGERGSWGGGGGGGGAGGQT